MESFIKNLKVIPTSLNKGFGLCFYGKLYNDLEAWASECNLTIEETDKFVNFYPTEETDFDKMFNIKTFEYMDGFSPNLNKHLHIGHFSNLVLAKAFQALGTSHKYISILGDTLTGDVTKEEALNQFKVHCKTFNYQIDNIYFASEMKCDESKFIDGVGDYEGTKIVQNGETKIVAIKKDGTTSYFYQDISLAEELNTETLYLTGYEQENHFNELKKIYPFVNHIGLGLLKFQSNKLVGNSNEKMSTRLGNVVYLEDLMNDLMLEFNNDEKLCYNVFAGYILKANPTSDKVFNFETIKNYKSSFGLYLSYTMARLKSAGVEFDKIDIFIKQELKYNLAKSKALLSPMYLFDALINHCKEINGLYVTHHINGDEENKKMFGILLSDLALGMKKLGLFEIDKV